MTLILNPFLDLLVHEIILYHGRLLTFTVDTTQAPLRIIAAYAPHNDHDLAIRQDFWTQVEDLVDETPPRPH